MPGRAQLLTNEGLACNVAGLDNEQPERAFRGVPSVFLRGGALLAVALALAVAAGPRGRTPRQRARPDILLVTLDTTRADHTSAYGYDRPTTPRLEALAREGVRFDAAYAPMATTLPAHATLFTAELPRTLGITKNGAVLGQKHHTLAERLADSGYRTAAFVSSFPVDRMFGLAQGFEVYDDDFTDGSCPTAIQEWEGFDTGRGFCRRGANTTARAVEWLEAEGYLGGRGDEAPFFVWLHYFDPHAPYLPADEDAQLFPSEIDAWLSTKTAAYDGEIHYMDRALGAALDRLREAGRLDDTLVVVAADHGEGLMQHGHMHHSILIYDEDVRVPLIVHWPARIEGGRAIDEPVQLADVPPTLLELAGVPLPQNGVGESLAGALLDGAPIDPERLIFLQRREYAETVVSGHHIEGEKLGVRQGRWKYIEAREEGTAELYDLENDPHERKNVVDLYPDARQQLSKALARWQAGAARPTLPKVDPEAEQRLRALGYVP